VKLVLLGTTCFLPTDTAQTACYLLPEVGLLLDAGSGVYHLPEYLHRLELDIYLSHAHVDHTSGLDHLFASFLKWDVRMSSQPLSEENIEGFIERAQVALKNTRVHADKATLTMVQPKYAEIPLRWFALQPQEPLRSDGRLTHFILENNTIGYRLDWPGHSLAYITDTIARPTATYVDKISGVDVLLHDCCGPDRLSGLLDIIGHSHPTAVAQVAARAQVKRLLLIHHSPLKELCYLDELEQARQIFPQLEVGYDGMEIDF
jgi:ribonuclease Z